MPRRPDPDAAVRPDRRRLLKGAATLAAAAPLAAALDALAAEEPAKKPAAATPGKPADPYAAARPDLSVARTSQERATLEKQWKQMAEGVAELRKAPLDPATPPAFGFAALPRPRRKGGR